MSFHESQVVETRYGSVRGASDLERTWVWKSIPFARPPVGELRWRAPLDPEPWAGVREESTFAKLACQPARGRAADRTSEDCLYLNVWRPQSSERRLPVYFWIHGGGNTVSVPAPEETPGAAIAAREQVVFVSMQYRLGELGWLRHPALRTGDPLDDSGNFGLLDIIQALRFVRDNIEAFGGDPENVFVTGESAGAYDTLCLLLSPAARGLFHKAMAQSGRQNSTPLETADRNGEALLHQLLVNDGLAADTDAARAAAEKMEPEETARYLRSKAFVDLLRVRAQVPFLAGFRDGAVLHEDGFDALANGTYPNKVPVIVGMNWEEAKFQLAMSRAWTRLDEPTYAGIARYLSDLKRATGADAVLRALASNADQPPVYGYLLRWGAPGADGRSVMPDPWGKRLGAAHGIDIPFFFGGESAGVSLAFYQVGFDDSNRTGREALSRAMMAYAGSFARSADPNAGNAGLPEWRPWSNAAGGDKAMIFDADATTARLGMSQEELTEAQVREQFEQLPEELRKQIDRYARMRTG